MPSSEPSIQGTVACLPLAASEPARPQARQDEISCASRTPLLKLASYQAAVRSFSSPLGSHANFPPDIRSLVTRIQVWDWRGRRALHRLQSPPVFRQVIDFGSVVFDTHRLLRAMQTKRLDDWMSCPSTPREASAAFDSWRRAFVLRYDAIRALTADILISSNLRMFERNPLLTFLRNLRQLGDMFGGESYRWGGIGVTLGIAALAVREWRFLGRLIGGELASLGISLHGLTDTLCVDRINELAGEMLITQRHAPQLRRVLTMLRRHGVKDDRAETIVIAALRQADQAASKPWKGLVKLRQMVEYSCVDPRGEDFLDTFAALTQSPIQYTHTPGLEWVVRDYELGKKLLQMDGRIPEGSDTAGLQQGRVSVMPGISKATPTSTEFARKYFGPVTSFLNSMVTADGADHQRLRKPFMQFFSRRAVFDQAELVQATVNQLLDEAAAIARLNDGAFDFKKDFAFHFPIRIICGVAGIRGENITKVQRWTEESTRSMDTEAGVSVRTAKRGQISAQEQQAFFGSLLEDARVGKPASEFVRSLASNDTLSEPERIANLSVIVFAGFETTTGLLCLGVRELLKHPQQWEYLRSGLVTGPEVIVDGTTVSDVELRWYRWAVSEPREADAVRRERLEQRLARSEALDARLKAIDQQESRLEAAVEEMLRWSAPGSIIPLTASQDMAIPLPRPMTIRGESLAAGEMLKIAKGETVVVAVDEINRRCPLGAGLFDAHATGSFDVSRTDNTKHLSFGVKHMCIGATLARENAKRAVEGVLRRFPDLESNGPTIPQDMELFHGLASFPVRSRSVVTEGR